MLCIGVHQLLGWHDVLMLVLVCLDVLLLLPVLLLLLLLLLLITLRSAGQDQAGWQRPCHLQGTLPVHHV
jgi:hypothetical protein